MTNTKYYAAIYPNISKAREVYGSGPFRLYKTCNGYCLTRHNADGTIDFGNTKVRTLLEGLTLYERLVPQKGN